MLQYRGYGDRGKVSGRRCSGCGGIILFSDDFPYLHPAGAGHGKRNGIFHPLRSEGQKSAERVRSGVFCASFCGDRFSDGGDLCRDRRDHLVSAYARGTGNIDERVPDRNLCRDVRYLLYNFFAALLRSLGIPLCR